MKICKNCGNEFPLVIVVDGIRRNLKNRKYCLDCSPFGKHNTKTLKNDPKRDKIAKYIDKLCICEECGREYIYKRYQGHTTTRCNSCQVKTKRGKLKIKAVIMLGGKCSKCGYDRCLTNLCFHHINPEEKKMELCLLDRFPWSVVEAELKKCILLCTNCHGELHASDEQFNWK